MQLSDVDFGKNSTPALAITLIHSFGERARALAHEQAENCADYPDIAARWRQVANAISILTEAHLHMEIALDLLDSIDETRVPPCLDHAIVLLGIRDPEANGAPGREASALHRPSSRTRIQQSFDKAVASVERSAGKIDFDLASRYASLWERSPSDGPVRVERSSSTASLPRGKPQN